MVQSTNFRREGVNALPRDPSAWIRLESQSALGPDTAAPPLNRSWCQKDHIRHHHRRRLLHPRQCDTDIRCHRDQRILHLRHHGVQTRGGDHQRASIWGVVGSIEAGEKGSQPASGRGRRRRPHRPVDDGRARQWWGWIWLPREHGAVAEDAMVE